MRVPACACGNRSEFPAKKSLNGSGIFRRGRYSPDVLKSTTRTGALRDVRDKRERRDSKRRVRSSENREPYLAHLSRCEFQVSVGKPLWHGESVRVRTSRTAREHYAGCSKRPDFSPPRPWRAETRLAQARPQASRNRRRYRPHFVRPIAHSMDLGERENPSSNSVLRESQSVR